MYVTPYIVWYILRQFAREFLLQVLCHIIIIILYAARNACIHYEELQPLINAARVRMDTWIAAISQVK